MKNQPVPKALPDFCHGGLKPGPEFLRSHLKNTPAVRATEPFNPYWQRKAIKVGLAKAMASNPALSFETLPWMDPGKLTAQD